jgi:hypothetical protein
MSDSNAANSSKKIDAAQYFKSLDPGQVNNVVKNF